MKPCNPGEHNFPKPGSDCQNCGVNQYEISGIRLKGMKHILNPKPKPNEKTQH